MSVVDGGGSPAAPSLLERGLALLQAQRRALTSGDMDGLAEANLLLSRWMASLPRPGAATSGTPSLGAGVPVATLRGDLAINAALASQAATRCARGLEVLFPAAARTYGADGRARPPEGWTRRLAA